MTIETDAKSLGLSYEVGAGRERISGRLGKIVKLWAANGYDVVRDFDGEKTGSYKVNSQDGRYHACILWIKGEEDEAYSCTAIV